MTTMYPAKVNSPATTLGGGINDSVTTISLVDASVLPTAPNMAVIGTGEDAETILYTGISTNDLTGVTRGFQGTAKAWDSGTTVARMFTAYDHDTFKSNIETNVALLVGMSRKNAIINGGMDIWQRGTSFDNPNGVYTADRWVIDDAIDTNVKLLRSTTVPDASSSYSLRVEVMTDTGGAGSWSDIKQHMEDYIFFRGKAVTLSCYVKCDAGVSGQIFIIDSVGSNNTPISATTWTKYTVIRTVNAAATSLYIQLQVTRDGQAVGKGINFAQVQLEVGSVATSFGFRPIGQELALCQRYCYRINGDIAYHFWLSGEVFSTTQAGGTLRFPVTMRAAPTFTCSSTAADWQIYGFGACNAVPTAAYISAQGCAIYYTIAAANLTVREVATLLAGNVTTTWMMFVAEL